MPEEVRPSFLKASLPTNFSLTQAATGLLGSLDRGPAKAAESIAKRLSGWGEAGMLAIGAGVGIKTAYWAGHAMDRMNHIQHVPWDGGEASWAHALTWIAAAAPGVVGWAHTRMGKGLATGLLQGSLIAGTPFLAQWFAGSTGADVAVGNCYTIGLMTIGYGIAAMFVYNDAKERFK